MNEEPKNEITEDELAEMARLDARAKARREAKAKEGDGSAGSILASDATFSRLEELIAAAPEEAPEPEPEPPKPRILNETFFPKFREPWDVEDPGDEFRKRLAIAENIIREGGIGIFVGTHGTGKTRLLAEASRAMRPNGARYYKTSRFFERVRSTWSHGGPSQETVMNEFRSFSLLCLDEIDKRSQTENENALLFSVIDDRFDLGKPTLIAGNIDPKRISSFFDAAILDRARIGGGLIAFEGESFRRR